MFGGKGIFLLKQLGIIPQTLAGSELMDYFSRNSVVHSKCGRIIKAIIPWKIISKGGQTHYYARMKHLDSSKASGIDHCYVPIPLSWVTASFPIETAAETVTNHQALPVSNIQSPLQQMKDEEFANSLPGVRNLYTGIQNPKVRIADGIPICPGCEQEMVFKRAQSLKNSQAVVYSCSTSSCPRLGRMYRLNSVLDSTPYPGSGIQVKASTKIPGGLIREVLKLRYQERKGYRGISLWLASQGVSVSAGTVQNALWRIGGFRGELLISVVLRCLEDLR